jgi:hypothetical protein
MTEIRGNAKYADDQISMKWGEIETMWERMRGRGWREDQRERFLEDVRRCLAQGLPLEYFDEHLSESQRRCTNWYLASEST